MPLSRSRRLLLAAAALTTALVPAATPALAGAPGSHPNNLTTLGTRVLFIADDGAKGSELWRTDGATTTLLKEFKSGPQSGNPYNFTVAGSLMFLTGVAGDKAAVWRTNGTRAGTIELSQAEPDGPFVAVGSRIYYGALDDHGVELWTSDGSVSGTKRITDIQPGVADGVWGTAAAAFGTRVAFIGLAGDGSHELWRSGPTAGSARRIKQFGTGATINWIRNAGGTLYLEIEPVPGTRELWKSDGTTAGTTKIRNLPVSATQPTAVGSTLFFVISTDAAGGELWKSKGTAATTRMVKDILPGSGGSDPYGLFAVGTRLLFAATTGTGDQELWRSDGTKAGTVRVKNINATGPSFPDLPGVVIGTRAYFYADDGQHGAEPWQTDGTKAGTKLVGEVIPGPGGVYPGLVKVFGKVGTRIYFTADDGVHGLELWRTTSGGVALWANIKPD